MIQDFQDDRELSPCPAENFGAFDSTQKTVAEVPGSNSADFVINSIVFCRFAGFFQEPPRDFRSVGSLGFFALTMKMIFGVTSFPEPVASFQLNYNKKTLFIPWHGTDWLIALKNHMKLFLVPHPSHLKKSHFSAKKNRSNKSTGACMPHRTRQTHTSTQLGKMSGQLLRCADRNLCVVSNLSLSRDLIDTPSSVWP